MTKLIVPQIGDIVRGQVVTEAAHKLWVDLADKVDALEGVANDDLTGELTALGERIDSLETAIQSLPDVEIVEGSADLAIVPGDYDYFEVSCVFTVPAGSNLASYGFYYFGTVSGALHVNRSFYNESVEVTVTATASYRAEDFASGLTFLRTYSDHNSTGSQAPVAQRWIIRKFKEY